MRAPEITRTTYCMVWLPNSTFVPNFAKIFTHDKMQKPTSSYFGVPTPMRVDGFGTTEFDRVGGHLKMLSHCPQMAKHTVRG